MFESDGAVRVVDEKKLGKKIREFFFCLWYFAANLDPACQHLGGGPGGDRPAGLGDRHRTNSNNVIFCHQFGKL
jgi:hypothetical protein